MKAGRNDPCPCGSGKKFKKCHGASGPKKFVATVISSGNSGLAGRISSFAQDVAKTNISSLSLKDRVSKEVGKNPLAKEIEKAKFEQEHTPINEEKEDKKEKFSM
jgi:hypothetical protein